MATGRGWGGASRAVPTTPRWLAPAPPLLIQGGELCRQQLLIQIICPHKSRRAWVKLGLILGAR